MNILKNNALKSTREVDGGLYNPTILNLLLLITNSTARLSKPSFTAIKGIGYPKLANFSIILFYA